MTILTNTDPAITYGDVLTIDNQVPASNQGSGMDTILKPVQDGLGNSSPMYIATDKVNFVRGAYEFQLDGVALTATSASLNSLGDDNKFQNTEAAGLPLLAADPVIDNGRMYYNTITNQLKACVNGAWMVIA